MKLLVDIEDEDGQKFSSRGIEGLIEQLCIKEGFKVNQICEIQDAVYLDED